MPRDAAGSYTLVAGNPVLSGTVISSSWANATLNDVSTALTDSLDRYGRGGMLASFRFADGTKLLPSASFVNETSSGLYREDSGDVRMAILTQDVMRWQTSGVQIWDNVLSQWFTVSTANDDLLPLENTWTALNTFTTGVKSEKLQIDDGNDGGTLSLGALSGLGTMIKGYSVDHPSLAETLEFYTGNAARMSISSVGFVSIDSPTTVDERLVVGGDVKVSTGTGSGILHFGITSDVTKLVGRDSAHPTLPNTLEFWTGSSKRGEFDAAGTFYAYNGFKSAGAGTNSFRAGNSAGDISQGANTVAIGLNAGNNTQGENSVAVGTNAGLTSQSTNSVAVGVGSGQITQGTLCTAVGVNAGYDGQSDQATALGYAAGQNSQGTKSVAIGSQAGQTSQSTNAIAIGNLAGQTSQHANSIVISAKGSAVNTLAQGSVIIQSYNATLNTLGINWGHTGTMTSSSDIRLKKDIEPITGALGKVQELNGVTFMYTDEHATDRSCGLIAQDVQAVMPEAVIEVDADGHLGVAYGNLVGLLVESIKELTARVEALEA